LFLQKRIEKIKRMSLMAASYLRLFQNDPDEDKVVEIKQEWNLEFGVKHFDTLTSPNSPFLNRLS
jgi:hypothetical protein